MKNSRILLFILTSLIYSATILTALDGTSHSMPAKNNNNKTAVYGAGNDNNKVIRFKQMAKQFFVFSSQQKTFDASAQGFRQIDALIANNSNGTNTATILSLFRGGDKQEQEFSKQSKSLPSITDYNVIRQQY